MYNVFIKIMQAKQPFLSVIIPSYNEVANLERRCLDEVVDYLEKQSYRYEIILSDDGSTDDTIKLLRDWQEKFVPKLKKGVILLLKNPHGGKVFAVRAGVKAATGRWKLFTDFDQSTHINQIEKLFSFQNDGFDIIFGSRRLNESLVKAKWYRRLAGNTFNWLTRQLLGLKIHDTQCGFKMFNQKSAKLFDKLQVYGRSDSDAKGAFTGAFDVELLYLAKKNGLKCKEVPVAWQHYATKRVSLIKDSIKMFLDILKIKQADRQGRY